MLARDDGNRARALAIDGYRGRRELEIACRRYLMDCIDIGMDVHGEGRPVIGGQVIVSSPGGPCMTCMGFLTDEKLGAEAARYGKRRLPAAGGLAQRRAGVHGRRL